MNVQKQIDRLITERASQWLETLRSGRTEEYAEFVRWIAESPRHMQEFLALLALGEELPSAFAHADIDRDSLLERIRSNVRALENPVLAAPPSRLLSKQQGGKRSQFWKFAAAAVVVVSLGGGLWFGLGQAGQKFSTAIGEQRTVALADGSLMYLNAHSVARVKLEKHARDIELVEGEALFQVTHDQQRPFRVHTQDVTVQAIGTRFNVDTRETKTVVSVLEGKVEVSTDAGADRTPAQPLSAGEAADVTREGNFQRRAAADVSGMVAWRQRQLVFSKTSLEEVADDFNRFHRKGRMVLEDVPPGSHHYTGTFDADDAASFVLLLSREKDLTIEQRDGDYIIRAR